MKKKKKNLCKINIYSLCQFFCTNNYHLIIGYRIARGWRNRQQILCLFWPEIVYFYLIFAKKLPKLTKNLPFSAWCSLKGHTYLIMWTFQWTPGSKGLNYIKVNYHKTVLRPFMKRFILSAKFITFAARNNLIGTKISKTIIYIVSKFTKMRICSWTQSKDGILDVVQYMLCFVLFHKHWNLSLWISPIVFRDGSSSAIKIT